MEFLVSLILATIVAAILMAILASKKNYVEAFLAGIACLISFSLAVFGGAPEEIGAGKVYRNVEKFARKLDSGVAYQLVASAENGTEKIVLLRQTGTPNFYALRVKEVPPEHFTLIGGKPVAIAPPVPPVGVK
jgi:hypothetical protein